MRVFNLNDYKRLKGIVKTDISKEEIEDIRVDRIKKSINRINQLMNNLREKDYK